MKSKLTIEVDFEDGNSPVIRIFKPENEDIHEDVRDKLVSAFLEMFGHTSSWAKVKWLDNGIDSNQKIFQRIQITPIPPQDLAQEAEFMKRQVELNKKHLQKTSISH